MIANILNKIYTFVKKIFNSRKKQQSKHMKVNLEKAIEFLNLHHESFFNAKPYADETEHPAPSDTANWSQILSSLLTGIKGYARKKGPDLADGSDVKGANTWGAIDTPRFNGVIKAGTKSEHSGNLTFLDTMPNLIFVLWDNEPDENKERCRVWVSRPPIDPVFREMCELWYQKKAEGLITSNNFQLHPPRNKNSNIFRNRCGNLSYPLLLDAHWIESENSYKVNHFEPKVLTEGKCSKI